MKQYKVVYGVTKEVVISENEYNKLYGDLTPLKESLAFYEKVNSEDIFFIQDYKGNAMREIED